MLSSGQGERQRLQVLEIEVESLKRQMTLLRHQTKILWEMIEHIGGVDQ